VAGWNSRYSAPQGTAGWEGWTLAGDRAHVDYLRWVNPEPQEVITKLVMEPASQAGASASALFAVTLEQEIAP